ncbi:MAG: hypothetical protein J6A20_08830 [Muribaculaceae bacterium]|nr:hypothetical protein [Muribaculaceae bacterium]
MKNNILVAFGIIMLLSCCFPLEMLGRHLPWIGNIPMGYDRDIIIKVLNKSYSDYEIIYQGSTSCHLKYKGGRNPFSDTQDNNFDVFFRFDKDQKLCEITARLNSAKLKEFENLYSVVGLRFVDNEIANMTEKLGFSPNHKYEYATGGDRGVLRNDLYDVYFWQFEDGIIRVEYGFYKSTGSLGMLIIKMKLE